MQPLPKLDIVDLRHLNLFYNIRETFCLSGDLNNTSHHLVMVQKFKWCCLTSVQYCHLDDSAFTTWIPEDLKNSWIDSWCNKLYATDFILFHSSMLKCYWLGSQVNICRCWPESLTFSTKTLRIFDTDFIGRYYLLESFKYFVPFILTLKKAQ